MSQIPQQNTSGLNHLWDYIQRNLFITFGVGGIILGALLMSLPKNSFHEIEYEPRVLLENLLSQNDSLTLLYKGKLDDTLLKEIEFRKNLIPEINDSTLDALLIHDKLFVNKDSFKIESLYIEFKAINQSKEDSVPFYWDYYINSSLKYNKPIKPCHLTGLLYSKTTVFDHSLDFFTEYPGFALWTFLIILQFGLFSFLIMFSWKEIQIFNDEYGLGLDNKAIFRKSAAAFMIILVFVFMGYMAFFTKNIISNGLFYNYIGIKLSIIVFIIIALGSITAAGFNIVTDIDLDIQANKILELNTNENKDDDIPTNGIIKKFNATTRLFNRMLVTTSISLSLIVLTIGILFHSVNELEFISKISDDFNFSPVADYQVMLIGIMCTTIILLFFFPAKIQLINYEKAMQKLISNKNNGQSLEVPEPMLPLIKTFFTISLPAIGPIIHYIINLFSN